MRILLILSIYAANTAICQLKITPTHSNQQWIQYYNTIKISEKYSIQSDLGYRCNNSILNPAVALIRTGFYYSFSPASKLGGGYANFDYFANKKESKNENRIYFEYSYKYKIHSLKLDNRFRFEERFFKAPLNQYPQTRLRYYLSIGIDIWKSKEKERKISFFETNELFYTLDSKSNSSYLDQLRFVFGSSFQLNTNFSVQLSYNAQFNKNAAINKSYFFTNILWFTARQTIEMHKRTK